MARRTAWRVCSTPGCPEFTDRGGRCPDHRAEADKRRGTARQRGYGAEHESRFRPGVLARDPLCVCDDTDHGHDEPCGQPSKHADHWPLDRRQLVQQGLDANAPRHGRGLCQPCHGKVTAANPDQQGGWNRRE